MRTEVKIRRVSSIPSNCIMAWIEENTKGEVKYDSSLDKRFWIWYFSDPQEATLFALRWS